MTNQRLRQVQMQTTARETIQPMILRDLRTRVYFIQGIYQTVTVVEGNYVKIITQEAVGIACGVEQYSVAFVLRCSEDDHVYNYIHGSVMLAVMLLWPGTWCVCVGG